VARTLTTIHMQDLAGDERGVLQVNDRVDGFVDLAKAAHRVQQGQRVVRGRIVHRCADDAERDSVGANPAGRVLDRERFGYRVEPPFVSDVNAEGTWELAWSTKLVEMFTTWPPPFRDSIAATAARETSKKPRRFTPVTTS